ncbi:MAG: S46 family peptidase [Paraburkholderia sp.]|uniref:S46 family peptidase n=1 Tax=Paraburkholderia sp. TaxID=1926495 RepID=UPI003C4F1831
MKTSLAAGMTLVASVAFISLNTYADEGMWQPPQVPDLAPQLKQRGLALDPSQLSTLKSWPLDAVVNLGSCTASFVSPDGLIVTNHHCGYGALQYNATPKKNLINDGFVAHTKIEELPASPTQHVYVTEQISDVTEQINAALKPGMDGYARYVAIDEAKKHLVQGCEQPGYRCDVYTFSGGYDYQLIRQKELRDVRLVYAPPLSVGKYGGDIDNWMWPRHTGDFSFLRAYVAKDGSSASYSTDNVPYRPKHWLTINPAGVSAGDFVMVAGYPDQTDRHRTADEMQNAIDWQYPTLVAILKDLLAMVDTGSKKNPEVAVKYASFVASVNNTMKYFQGNIDGLTRSNALTIKRAEESQLDQGLSQQTSGGATDGPELRADVTKLRRLVDAHIKQRERLLVMQLMQRGGLFQASYQIVRLAQEKQKPDLQREAGFQQRDEARLLGQQQALDRTFDSGVDQQMLVYTLQRYVKLPSDQRLPALERWLGGATDEAALTPKVAMLYAGTALTDTKARVALLSATPAQIDASKDTWIALMRDLMPDLIAYQHEEKAYEGDEAAGRAGYMKALVAYNGARGLPVYHDANDSLRITFGTVQGYEPRDGVEYTPFTTVDGILQKDTGAEPFNAPPAELAAIRAKAFDGVASPVKGTLPVNFLADLDITAGDSGSPTLDRNGKLVGLAFDGSWEGVSSGWLFNPAETRSIQVDVRYMLWVMHHLDHADNLLDEMQVKVGQSLHPWAWLQ